MPGFVITESGSPVGPIRDDAAVILFNFRGDRAIELSRAFETEGPFDRGVRPDVLFAGMMQYDGDLLLPKQFLVAPPEIEGTSSELLSQAGISQLAISETQKYGHVTYFWNGNKSERLPGETWIEIPSDVLPFEERPWMKAAEITDRLIADCAPASTGRRGSTMRTATWWDTPGFEMRRGWRWKRWTCRWAG